MLTDFIEKVYESLNGESTPENQVPGVENVFSEGKECELLYRKVYDAHIRLSFRLFLLFL